jgi:hypothetical protein
MASSDHEFYQLFKTEPRFLDVFIEMHPERSYTFESVTFKKVQRSCDGLLQSDDPDEACVIFEFQMQKKPNIYQRIITEMAMFQTQNPGKKVRGVIVFQDPETDPDEPHWKRMATTCPELIKVLYLNEIYEDLKQKKPNSPLQAVFAPFVEKDPKLIRQNAKKWSQQLNQLPYNQQQRETILVVFLSWLVNCLPDITKKELKDMTSLAQNIRHTQFFKDVAEEVWPDHQLKLLQEQLEEGVISREYFDRKVKELKKKYPT